MSFFTNHSEALKIIAAGEQHVWTSDNVSITKFRLYVKQNWLMIAANSQLAERWVKDSNECTYTNKDEKMANILALIRSSTVFTFRDIADNNHSSRDRQSTKHYSSGKKGSRIDKRTGAIEVVRELDRDNVRGSLLVTTIINETIKMGELIGAANINPIIKQKITQHLTKDEFRFETLENNKVVEELAGRLHLQHKNLNAIQKQKGYETTSFLKEEIKFSKVITKHMQLVKDELDHRQLTYEITDKITVLKNILKQDEYSTKAKAYELETGLPAKPVNIDNLHFSPRLRSAPEWGDAYHIV